MSTPIDYSPLLTQLKNSALCEWAETLPAQITSGLSEQRYGDLPSWYHALNSLPKVKSTYTYFGDKVTIGKREELSTEQYQQLESALRSLIPWRKGPFELFGLHIDTEWRSDWKWQRLQRHIAPLKDRNVLDVGCGNGYHCWRMYGEGASQVIGIDPSPRFIVQFYMVKHFLENCSVDLLPVGIEALPPKMEYFDTTFSMGVLYHRRSPMDHLLELRDTLKPGGELVLETLVIDGGIGDALVPEGRYGKMNNVWFLPSVPTLLSWLKKCGFVNARCINQCTTDTKEQRTTDWMQFQSLEDFLDPTAPDKTIEGHPGPVRAVIVANKRK
ncbi:tRNA 5-methoxyuridine(34)/uridine 5-oxyacetic acid(34) synthase CmoB [Teredinibacter haidensis]|uniref:tRNA 5-methoxyuridine(34)/uridine 5-oxyacetic acid(34) synthase CmoB n=1 Tax=Teredinibacter haidensis TaxID=2731755 RepID=UPI000948F73B|nr:tRNA 5-methoxyuridine(34)/uridine 5-oxyacetic acid(34) synthase CmoB [Teredinibacter haidensis]